MSQDHGFPGVVGHARVTDMLSRAIERQRLHHGLVFCGPRGIGKATLARGLACALICDVAPARGCGSCDACRRLLSGRHTDLRRLEGQGKTNTIAAEPAREVALRSQHAPFEARAHVIIIDPADRMHPRAAAAMLKSIEEPSAGVYWTLIGANRSDILDTILSRCMTIPLEGLSLADTRAVVLAELARDPSAEAIDDARRELAISLADGSPGVALELLRDPSLEPTRELLAATLRALELGPPAVFSGDRSPLWSAWNTAVLATPDPSAEQDEGDDGEDEVIVVKSKRKPKKKSKKSKSSKSDSKATPARQRAMAGRLAELWLLHLRELLLGREGLRGMPRLQTDPRMAGHMQTIQQFQTNLARNPNVRLNFEQLLLSLGS
ncbi:DNA polymerase III delta prime subunit [Enhygromyxa salina]|uniref:DNA polymerase III delta prime subunit n=1 Tax=Enhygromyxa salina TaxID=215803 RepID=A0A0C2DGK0_9BACT|nr:AAA family ATPase [Enhygromyxa salina]KIG18797.1 DNA polymerase III delta prime subunit [Enhygromyxa salina]